MGNSKAIHNSIESFENWRKKQWRIACNSPKFFTANVFYHTVIILHLLLPMVLSLLLLLTVATYN